MPEQITTLQPVEEPTQEQMDIAWGCLKSTQSPHGGRDQARTAAHADEPTHKQMTQQVLQATGEPCWSSLAEGPNPMVWTHIIAVLEDYSLWEIHTGSVCEGLHPIEGTPCWSRERECLCCFFMVKMLWIVHNVHTQFSCDTQGGHNNTALSFLLCCNAVIHQPIFLFKNLHLILPDFFSKCQYHPSIFFVLLNV